MYAYFFSALLLLVCQAFWMPIVIGQNLVQTEKQAADDIAKQLKDQLLSQNVKDVKVRNVRGGRTTDAMLTTLLKEAFKPNFRLGPGGVDIVCRVEPLRGSVESSEVIAGYRLRAEAKDLTGERFFNPVFVEVMNDIDGAVKAGPHGIERAQPPKKLGGPFQHLPREPNVEKLISFNKIFPHPQSPYAAEILVMSGGRLESREPKLENGALTVVLNQREQYVVRVYNNSAYEAFVSLSIDGVNRYALSRNEKDKRNVDLIPPGGFRDLKGYFLSEQEASSFLVGSYEESVATRLLGEAPDIGVISLAIGVSYPKGSTIPNEETESVQVTQTVVTTRTETKSNSYEVTLPDGSVETRERTYSVLVPVMEQREATYTIPAQTNASGAVGNVVGTTEGPKVKDPLKVQPRTLGKVRAIIKVRYHAE